MIAAQPKTLLGIDPGLDGGLAWIADGQLVGCEVMPTINAAKGRDYDLPQLIDVIRTAWPQHAVLERSQAMPGQGVTSMFSIGKGYGLLLGILSTFQIPFEVVSAQAWTKEMLAGLPKEMGKARGALACSRLWPTYDFRASPKCKKAHSGQADAALIALWGWRKMHR